MLREETYKYRGGKLRSVCVVLLLAFGAQDALANPMGGSVVSGQASMAASGNVLTVTNTPGTIIHWQDFSIGANEITRFVQQSASSAVLNRVVGNNPSQILGALQSNGRVFLINPGGIVFGGGATVDVAGMVASTLNLSNADFLAGRNNFTQVPGAQNISNAGNLAAQQGGQIFLIAPNVENSGLITAPGGEILLAAGNSVELVNSLDPNLRVNITAPAGDVTNIGQLVAEAGSLGLFGTVVKSSGTVSADSATMQGGKIVFKASQRVEISGTVSANALSSPDKGRSGGVGGVIEALGDQVGIMDGASLSVDGAQGGGTILVGGDYQGKNPDVQNATITYVASTAILSADATDNGDGGKVIVWADDTTRAYGNISARGGANGGDGGFVEVSGHNYLDFQGRVDTLAPMGLAGTLLLDPSNITIDNTVDTNVSFGSSIFTSSPTVNSVLKWATINAQSGNITVQTDADATSGSGNININASGTVNGPTSLTLLAHNNIDFASGVSVDGDGDFNLVAGWSGTGMSVTQGAGNIQFNAGSSLSSGGGILLRSGASVNVLGAQVAAIGDMTVDVGGNLAVVGGPNYAKLGAGGLQTVNFTGASAHALSLLGGTVASGAGAGVGASIESGGAQTISHAGTLNIFLTGGDVSATGLSSTNNGDGTQICSTCATHNSASIRSLNTQTINATNLSLEGGTHGNGNSARIESTGVSNITVTGAVILSGGASGGHLEPGFDDFKGIIGNEASLDSNTSLNLHAGSLTMLGGTATYGGAFIGSPILNITTTGDMGMTGGSGSSGGAIDQNNPHPSSSYVWFNPVAIGYDSGTPSVTLNVGGDLTVTGGAVGATGGSLAMIGSLGVADVTINGNGNVTLNSANQFAERIGSWKGQGGSVVLKAGLGGAGVLNLGKGLVGTGANGSITLDAYSSTGAAITQNASGRIEAATLDAATLSGDINLPGSNKVGSVTASANGNLAYNSIISFLANSVASTTGSVALTTTGSVTIAGNLQATGAIDVTATSDINQTSGVISNSLVGGAAGTNDITFSGANITLEQIQSQRNVVLNATGGVNLLAQGSGGYIDDTYFVYNLPFAFNYFGTSYNQAYITTNGLIMFVSGTSTYSDSLAGLGVYKAIAPAWNDWIIQANVGKDIRIGFGGSDVRVRYDVARYGNTSLTSQFEAVLNTNGVITFNYGAANNSFAGDVTIGISNGAGSGTAIQSQLMNQPNFSMNNLVSTTFTPNGSGGYTEAVSATNTPLSPQGPVSGSALLGQGSGQVINALGMLSISAGGVINAPSDLFAHELSFTSYGGAMFTGNNQFSYISSALNYTSGNLVVYNTAAPLLTGTLSNNGGNIVIDNVGGIDVAGAVDTSGNLDMTAHSPITVRSSASVTAGGNINLTAVSSGASSTADLLSIAGSLTSTAGSMFLNGGSGVTFASTANLHSVQGSISALSAFGPVTTATGATLVAPGGISLTAYATTPIDYGLVSPEPEPEPLVEQPVLNTIVAASSVSSMFDAVQSTNTDETDPESQDAESVAAISAGAELPSEEGAPGRTLPVCN